MVNHMMVVRKNNGNNYNKLKPIARELRNNQTEAEKKFWEIVRNRKINNLKFLRQKVILEYVVDFYCHELRLAIEIDGKIHESQKERDEKRDGFLKEKYQINILRYTNEFILKSNSDQIIKTLRVDLKSYKPK